MYCLIINGRLTLAYMKQNSLDILDLPQVELKIFRIRKWEAKDFKKVYRHPNISSAYIGQQG